jgi:hypothetical protein
VPDGSNVDGFCFLINGIDHAPITDADSPIATAADKFGATAGARIGCQLFD